jgi:hypothetical protein
MGHSARRSEDGGPCRGSGGRHGGASGGPVKCGQRTGGLGLQCSGARGAQAAADALRRRQKANKAALTKKHAVYKSKIRLLQGLEKQKSAAPEVYVAPELNYVGHTGDEAAVSGDAKKCKRASGNDDVAGNVKYGGGKPEKSAPTSRPFESRSSEEEDDSGKDDDVVNLSKGSAAKAAISGLSSDHPPKVPIPGSADGRMEMKRKFQPYQKELAIAAARQAEIVCSCTCLKLCFRVLIWSLSLTLSLFLVRPIPRVRMLEMPSLRVRMSSTRSDGRRRPRPAR